MIQCGDKATELGLIFQGVISKMLWILLGPSQEDTGQYVKGK